MPLDWKSNPPYPPCQGEIQQPPGGAFSWRPSLALMNRRDYKTETMPFFKERT